ncbi:transposase [Desulfovibrio sp. TomC]|uniref:transposase n=1 Tax=Desulfovibrio sp. TomC TaxID=1562888 RepID=UPI0012E1E302
MVERRHWPLAEKLRIVEESLLPGVSVVFVARKHDAAPKSYIPIEEVCNRRRLNGCASERPCGVYFQTSGAEKSDHARDHLVENEPFGPELCKIPL